MNARNPEEQDVARARIENRFGEFRAIAERKVAELFREHVWGNRYFVRWCRSSSEALIEIAVDGPFQMGSGLGFTIMKFGDAMEEEFTAIAQIEMKYGHRGESHRASLFKNVGRGRMPSS